MAAPAHATAVTTLMTPPRRSCDGLGNPPVTSVTGVILRAEALTVAFRPAATTSDGEATARVSRVSGHVNALYAGMILLRQ
jgi:hypothetical protein